MEKSISTTEWLVALPNTGRWEDVTPLAESMTDCPYDRKECRCAGSSISNYSLQVFSSLISRDYFPVLEEGIFAKNTALNHILFYFSRSWIFSPLVSVPAQPSSPLWSPSSVPAQTQSAGRYLYLAIATFCLKTRRPNGQPPTKPHHNLVFVTPLLSFSEQKLHFCPRYCYQALWIQP